MTRITIIAALLLAVIASLYAVHRHGYKAGADAVRSKWQAAQAAADARNRETERELTNARDQHAQSVASLHADLDRARAAAESVRLRTAAQAAADRARQACANSTTAQVGEAAGDPIGVLADVLGRADDRAGLLADLADRRYIAGRACEREYEAVRQSVIH